jgi:AAA domain
MNVRPSIEDVVTILPTERRAAPFKHRRRFTPTPFCLRNSAAIPKRQFLYGRHYIRNFLSATVASGGVGKSSLLIAECVAMASGRKLFGVASDRPLKVWYWNGEDPYEEIERRIAAVCLQYGIDWLDLGDRLFIDSGRDTEITIAEQTKSGAKVAGPVEDALVEALIAGRFDVFVADPVVSTHRVSENDNMAVDMVAKTFGRIAGRANCAVEVAHHVRKTGGAEVTAEDSRGASAWVAAARSVRVLNRMSDGEAAKAGVSDDERRSYFRVGIDKANLAPSSKAVWFNLANVGLGNGSGGDIDDQDYVGVVTSWKWPDAFADVTASDLDAVRTRVAGGDWRKDPQAHAWVGKAIAEVLRLDVYDKTHRAKINALLAGWINSGALVEVEGLDAGRRPRVFVKAGQAER